MSSGNRENSSRPIVLDVSRMIWRRWSLRLPTGIDRVCLAYLAHFGPRSLAMVQWRGRRIVLCARDSEHLFDLLLDPPGSRFRRCLLRFMLLAVSRAIVFPAKVTGKVFLNVGHTGLDAADLADWLSQKGLAPVYLVHDLIPITHPQFCREGEAARHAARMRTVLESARGVICNSEATCQALGEFADAAGLDMPASVIAHLGVEPLAGNAEPMRRARPYFLSVSTIEGRKNHALLLDVWQILQREMGEDCPDLVLIGQRGWQAQDVFDRLDALGSRGDGLDDAGRRVFELSGCSDCDLARWLDGACAVLMPSHAEGFGLPVIEALSRRTPVIAADLDVYRELAGSVPCLLDPNDRGAWQQAIRDHVEGGTARERQILAAHDYNPPDWPDHFAIVERWLQEIGLGR